MALGDRPKGGMGAVFSAADRVQQLADSPANVRPKGWEKRAGMDRDAA